MAGAGYGGAGRVLIVDDDPAICALLNEALSDAGLEAACARDGHAAYALIPTLPTFSALVVDVDLGAEATGFDVARFARRVIPDLLVIYMSGATSSAALDAFGVPDGQFLQKPFTPHDLVVRLVGRDEGSGEDG